MSASRKPPSSKPPFQPGAPEPSTRKAAPATKNSPEPWHSFILVAGLAGSGKTLAILQLLAAAALAFPQKTFGAAKPFDTGLSSKNAADRPTDGEVFSAALAQQPNTNFLTPYLTYADYPFEFSLAEEGNRLNYGFLESRLLKLTEFFSPIFLESPGGLATPLSHRTAFVDWAKAKLRSALLVFDLDPKSFSSALLEAEKLQQAFPHSAVLLNAQNSPASPVWLDYVQNKLEQEIGLAVLGFLPYQKTFSPPFKALPTWLKAFADFIHHAENL